MKKWYLHILLLAGLFGMLTTSCSQDEALESRAQASEEKMQVSFTIAMGNSSDNSRAAEENYPTEEEIVAFENRIDQLHVQLQMSENTSPVDVVNIAYWQVGTNVYKFVGEVKDVASGTSLNGVKVFVYANTSKTNGAIKKTFVPTYSGSNEGKGVESIPMWGVHTITANLSLTSGTCVDLPEPIYLLRAMAKVEVNLGSNAISEGFSIDGVEMQKYNSLGNLEPNTVANANGINTADYHNEACINAAPAGNVVGIPLDFIKIGENRFIIYVPEFKIGADANFNTDDNMLIRVKIVQGEDEIWASLKNGGAFPIGDLVRNYYYIYSIDRVNINVNVISDFTYQVIDWTEIDNGSLNFGNSNGNV